MTTDARHTVAPRADERRCSVCGSTDRPQEIVPCGVCDEAFHFGPGGASDCGDVVVGQNCCGVVLRCGHCRDRGAHV